MRLIFFGIDGPHAGNRDIERKKPTSRAAPGRSSGGEKKVKKLKNISEIRRFFHRNETPIYFISARSEEHHV